MTNQALTSLRHRKAWLFWLLSVLLIIFILLTTIRIFLPYAIKWGAISWLESQRVQATIVDVDIELYEGLFVINGLAFNNSAGNKFTLGQIKFSWQWQPLLQHQLYINNFTLDSLKLDATLSDEGVLNISGIELPLSSDTSPSPEPDTTTDPDESWSVNLAQFNIANVEICGEKLASDLSPSQQACIKLSELGWAGEITLNPVHDATKTNKPLITVTGALAFDSPDICFKQYKASDTPQLDYCAGFNTLDWQGSINISHDTANKSALLLYTNSSIKLDDIFVHNKLRKRNLLTLGSFKATNVNINTLDNITVDSIQLNQLSTLQRTTETSSDSHVFSFDLLNIQKPSITNLNNLVINAINLNDPSGFIYVQKNGELEFLSWLPAKQDDSEPPQTTTATTFAYSIQNISINSLQHFIYQDDSLKETFRADIHHINLALDKINSNQPDLTSHLLLSLAIDSHGALKLDTTLNPLSDKPSISGEGRITGLDLRVFAPFTKQHIGHNIKSGQLDSDLKIAVDQGVINSNISLALHQFTLKSLSPEESKKLDSEFGFPLNSSLSLLRDRNNTIKLDIPITGDIDNPEFNPRDAIVQASSKAITTAVLYYYTPLGLVFAADTLFDLATALSFEPVVFLAGDSSLSTAHKERLTQLASLMTERPGIHLTFCGLSNIDDRNLIFPPQKATAIETPQKSETIALNEQQLKQLHQLANARSASIKNQLVKQYSIQASRIIECSPEYKPDDISGVEINL